MAFILVPIESSFGRLEASILSGSLTFGGRLAVLKLIERCGFGAMVGNSEFANGHSKTSQVMSAFKLKVPTISGFSHVAEGSN